jgi:hypothetical protein
MFFPYNEYRIFKSVYTKEGDLGRKEKNGGDESIQVIIYVHENVTMKLLYSCLKQTSISFLKNVGKEGKTGTVGGWYQWEGGGHK